MPAPASPPRAANLDFTSSFFTLHLMKDERGPLALGLGWLSDAPPMGELGLFRIKYTHEGKVQNRRPLVSAEGLSP